MNIETIGKLFKYSWAQANSDQNGKSTLMPGTALLIVIVGSFGFCWGTVTKDSALQANSVIVISIGAGIMVGRKIVNGKPESLGVSEDGAVTNKETLEQKTTLTKETTNEQPK